MAGESAQLSKLCPTLPTGPPGEGPAGTTGQGKAHLTYLCVGGLAQCVVAMPEDRYLSLRRSMRRTFTKSLGAGGLDRELGAKPKIQGQEACLRGGARWRSPGGDHPARSPRRDIVGDEGVVLDSLQDLKAIRGDVSYSPAQGRPRDRAPAPQGTPRPTSSLPRSLYEEPLPGPGPGAACVLPLQEAPLPSTPFYRQGN